MISRVRSTSLPSAKLKALDSDNLLFCFTRNVYAPFVAWAELSLQNKAKVKQREISATSLGS